KSGIGLDAKIGVTSGLNLDLTINPDFSNVEADRQVVNLTRFDVNLPEQRQFFIENSDLFTGFGSLITNPFLPPTGTLIVGNQLYSPFFSRKIGIGLDTSTGVNVQSRINYGARLSGKIGDTWRVGILNSQTAEDEEKGIEAENFTVFAVQKRIFQRSNIAAIFVNKFNPNSEALDNFNRVGGLEYNLQSNDNKWIGKLFYHYSFDRNQQKNPFATGLLLNYNTRKFIAKWSHDYLGKGFNAEAGFVPRGNFFHFNPTFGFNFFPKSKVLNRYSFGLNYDQYQSKGTGVTDRKAGPFVLLVFQNTMRLLTTFSQNLTYLSKDFDALRSNSTLPKLKAETGYIYYSLDANLVTDLRKKISLNFNPLVGQYYDGRIISMSGNLNYRFQPYGLVAMNYSYNDIKLSTGKNKVYVIGPNVDFTLSKKLFWTNYVQYNSQFKNLNVNSRFQWRFAPVSDFFLVYSDNYNSEIWLPKNRALFVKLTYWLSL
ncbi:MAG: hydrolase, partial [Leadbetterella sp.]|nr:hydrolase [Leadbetterella sp.]